MRRPLAALALLCALRGHPATAQTVSRDFFGMSLEYHDTTTWPRIYVGASRNWYSDCSSTPSNWNQVATARATYTWTNFDCVVNNLVAHNVAFGYTFGQTPGWANGSTTADVPPTLESDYQAYVTAVVARYAGKIKYYGPWNEVDLAGTPTTGWYSGTKAQMKSYAQDVYTAVHAGDPKARVLSPSVEGASGPAYMQALLAAGVGSYFDVLNYHGYAFNTYPNQFPEQTAYIAQTFKQLAAMYGISAKPIFVDEGGYQPSLAEGLHAPYSAVMTLLLADAGVSQFVWFQFENGNGWGVLSDGANYLNASGIAYDELQKWILGHSFTTHAARTAGTNTVRTTGNAGYSAGTPGTPPTNWGVYSPDTASHGITTQVVGACTDGTRSGIDWMVSGTATAGAAGYADLFFETGNQIAAAGAGRQEQVGAYVRLDGGSTTGATVSLNLNEDDTSGAYLANDMAWVFNPVNDTLANDLITYFGRTTNASTVYVQPYIQVAYSVGVAVNITLCVAAPFTDNGSVWTAFLDNGEIVWDSHGDQTPSTYTVPGGHSYAYYRDLTGQFYPLGATVPITNSPIFLKVSP